MNTQEKNIRRFTNKQGFGDETAYIEIDGEESYLVNVLGRRWKTDRYPLSLCEKYVSSGDWVELPVVHTCVPTPDITEEQVVQWLQTQRKKFGCSHIQLLVAQETPARNGHGVIPPYSRIYGHKGEHCVIADSLPELELKLNRLAK